MTTMRDAFGDALIELAAVRDDFVVLDADVAGGTGTHVFRDAYPDRFIQCGIAEQEHGVTRRGFCPLSGLYPLLLVMRYLLQCGRSSRLEIQSPILSSM